MELDWRDNAREREQQARNLIYDDDIYLYPDKKKEKKKREPVKKSAEEIAVEKEKERLLYAKDILFLGLVFAALIAVGFILPIIFKMQVGNPFIFVVGICQRLIGPWVIFSIAYIVIAPEMRYKKKKKEESGRR